MGNTQQDDVKDEAREAKKEIPWLKIFIIIIALLLALNGIKYVATKISEKKGNDSEATTEESQDIFTSQKDKVKNTIDVPALEDSQLDVDGLTFNETDAEAAEFIVYSGSLTEDNAENVYDLAVSREGIYRFDFSNIKSPGRVRFTIYDSLEQKVFDGHYSNDEGATEADLKAGENYKLSVAYDNGECDYTLTIGLPKEEMDVSAYTSVKDSIEFTGQRNVYYYTSPSDGQIRLQFDDMQGSAKIHLIVRDDLNQNIADTYCGNGNGIVVNNFAAGATYEILVQQNVDFSSYTMGVYANKSEVDISDYTIVNDSLEFEDQCNVYKFTVPTDGRYRFELTNVKAGFRPHIKVFDANNQSITDAFCGNNEGLTIDDLAAGDVYEIWVIQDTDVGGYTFNVGKQKETIEVDGSTMVNDSIQYKAQNNVYLLQAESGKTYTATIRNMNADQTVELHVFDELGYEIGSNSYAKEDVSVTIGPIEGDQEINIQVRQKEGTGDYSVVIQEQ